MGESAKLGLAEDEPVVDRDLEAALACASERYLNQDWGPRARQFCRQTDGLIEIVSGNAVLDRDSVFGVEHASSLAEANWSEVPMV